MKKYLIRTYDLGTDNTKLYEVNAYNLEDAKNVFKGKCIPLFAEAFTWDDMTRMFSDCDITIDIIDVDNIIKL